jgi:hypothetical protein
MSLDISQLVQEWDQDYESTLSDDSPDKRQPYGKLLEALDRIYDLRFQPYPNDDLPNFIEKLRRWLAQFPANDKRTAFLLASRIVFVTQRQFESLQRRLYMSFVRRHLLDCIIRDRGLKKFDYIGASPYLASEMDATIFVSNSDSSHLNSFVHRNSAYFTDQTNRRLVGPELTFWIYPAKRSQLGPPDVTLTARQFETKVLATDSLLANKRRLIIIEDFSGSGSDLMQSLMLLNQSKLPLKEIVVAPVIATDRAFNELTACCQSLSSRRYTMMAAYVLREELCCFDGRRKSYLDGQEPILDFSPLVKQLSEDMYNQHFAGGSSGIAPEHRHGFGQLALAFVMFSNCPDNSLPILWKQTETWPHALFHRASRVL